MALAPAKQTRCLNNSEKEHASQRKETERNYIPMSDEAQRLSSKATPILRLERLEDRRTSL